MPSVEELLSVAEVDTNTRSAMDSRIEIDADTRIIRMMPQDELFGVESDEKSERKYFKVPKIVGNGVDLSKLQLRINYQNASKIPSGKDMYIVTDATVYNDEWVYFSWELSRKVTQYKGSIYFIVCAVKADSNGNITNEWNTTLAEGKVLEGLEVETSQEQQYQASDYLEQLKQQLLDYSKEIKDTFPSDYTQIQDDIGSLKGDLVELSDKKESEYCRCLMSASGLNFANLEKTGNKLVGGVKYTIKFMPTGTFDLTDVKMGTDGTGAAMVDLIASELSFVSGVETVVDYTPTVSGLSWIRLLNHARDFESIVFYTSSLEPKGYSELVDGVKNNKNRIEEFATNSIIPLERLSAISDISLSEYKRESKKNSTEKFNAMSDIKVSEQ